MAHAVESEVVEKLAAVTCSPADEPGAPVYVLLKPDVASERVEVGGLFVSEEQVFVLPYQYASVLLLLL